MTEVTGAVPGTGLEGIQDPVKLAWLRYEELKKTDAAKNGLIEELIFRYEYVSRQFKQLCEHHEQQKSPRVSSSQIEQNLRLENIHLRELVTQDPFVLILLNGDEMIFHEALLNDAEAGGMKAASLLRDSASTFVHELIDTLPKDVKIVARMYANSAGLADTCYKAGVVPSRDHVEEFLTGFTRGQKLFDFIDVGPGNYRVDVKLFENLKLQINDCHCKQIFLGCSHAEGYRRVLEKYSFDEKARAKITLLEGVPYVKETSSLTTSSCSFQHAKFGNLFRETPIDLARSAAPRWVSLNATALRTANGDERTWPIQTPSDSVSSSRAPSVVMNTWASKAAAAATLPDTPPPARAKLQSPSPSSPTMVPRNRKGQRVDADIPNFDKVEVDRVKKMKMCNVHFLRQECPYGDKCTHRHDYKPTKEDLNWLRVVARMAVCRFGTGCEDAKCIYGHRCQAPERLDKSRLLHDGGKSCIFGAECVFPSELHNMDCNIVKFIKV